MARNTTVAADNDAPARHPPARASSSPAIRPADGATQVEHEAHRTFLNWLGCAIGAARHPTLEAALAGTMELAPAAQASILGRRERVDMASAALLNGISSHTFDFDDTHLKTIIHPAGPVASAALALAERTGARGRELVDALVLGIDVACRVGNTIYPDHYDRGWHITGSTGMLGAAAACAAAPRARCRAHGDGPRHCGLAARGRARAVRYDDQAVPSRRCRACWAHRRAVREARLHGVQARAGGARAVFCRPTPRSATGEKSPARWASGSRSPSTPTSPFACGIVIHPSIDGCVQLRDTHALEPDDIERVELRVHPLVLELTGKKTPRTGLEAKFSVYHACAAGILFGRAGEQEFSDAVVARPEVIALRDRVHATADAGVDEASADIAITRRDGRVHRIFVEHAIGSLQHPMSDDDLARKFHDLVDPVLGVARADALIGHARLLASLDDVRPLVEATRPA